jgi:hypothetical protein
MTRQILILMSLLVTVPVAEFVAFFSSPPAQAQQWSGWQQFFGQIVKRSPLPRKRGGGRDTMRAWETLSPGAWSQQLWTLKPSLIWRIDPDKLLFPDRIEIVPAGATAPIWSQKVSRSSKTTIPIPAKFEPGKTYSIRFIKFNPNRQKDEAMVAWDFQIMTIAQRQKVTAELELIDKKLKPSAQLQRRLEVFGKYELWSDAFQEIEQSSLSPTERQTAIEQLLTQLKRVEPSGRGR